MNRHDVFEYVKNEYGTEPDYPWSDYNAVLRHNSNSKWYGLIMNISRSKLGLKSDKAVDILNVKCDSVLIGSLRKQPWFYPAYHMSKSKWISICLDGSVSDTDIINLIDMSYGLTKEHNAKNKRR